MIYEILGVKYQDVGIMLLSYLGLLGTNKFFEKCRLAMPKFQIKFSNAMASLFNIFNLYFILFYFTIENS